MITRIVKMKFKPENVEAFREIFDQSKKMISEFEGCLKLNLLKDSGDEFTYFTISLWNTENDLNNYRDSYIFKNTWSKVKPLFSEKAEAWSLNIAD